MKRSLKKVQIARRAFQFFFVALAFGAVQNESQSTVTLHILERSI